MRLARKKREMPILDVGPFSDIAFLLIIFFILTTTFVKPAGEKLNIPAGSESSEASDEENLTIGIKGETIRFGRGDHPKALSLEELKIALHAEHFAEKGESERNVVIDCSREVPYELYFRVVMAVTEAGGVVALMDAEGEAR